MPNKKEQYQHELEELAKRQYWNTIETKRAHIQTKNKYRNLSRCLNTLRREEEEIDKINRAKEPQMMRRAEIEEEECLAREINAIKREEVLEKKQRQLLRLTSEELRQFESKLRAAYVFKQQMAQLAEKKSMKMEEKLREEKVQELLHDARLKEKDYREHCKLQEMEQKLKYRDELHNQMIREEQVRRYQYEEFLSEKKMLDEIVQRINIEDSRAMEEKMCKMKKTQEEIEAFKKAQSIWREKRKHEIEEEDRRIQEYLLSKAQSSTAQAEAKARIQAEKQAVCDKMAKELYEIERKKRERADVVTQLLEEEVKEEVHQKHQNEVEKELRNRIETLTSLKRQIEERQEQAMRELELDAAYKEQMLKKIAEDERLEQLSNEKKRRKMIEIRKIVEQMMIERRQKKAEALQLEKRLLQEGEKAAEERNRIIQQERIKMLQQHAKNLIGFFPKGLLQEEDLPYLDSDIVNMYSKKKTDTETGKSCIE